MPHQSSILIVDDDPGAIERLRTLLGRNYQIIVAYHGQEALAKAQDLKPDLVVLDVMMPDMDGYETCRKLRADRDLAEVPILMLTALDDRTARLRGIEAGADDFISKPYDGVEFLTRVQTITRLNRYRRLLAERSRFETVVERSPDGIILVDPAYRVCLANPAIYRFLQRDVLAQPLIGLSVLQIVAPSHVDACIGLLQHAAAHPDTTVRAELLLLGQANVYAPAEIVAGSLVYEDRPSTQLIVRDIRERKRADLLLDVERRRMAYDLHDSLAQIAVGAYHHLQSFAAHYRSRNPRRVADLERALAMAEQVVRETRRLISGLHPSSLDDFGLVTTLRLQIEALQSDGWLIDLTAHAADGRPSCARLPSEIETTLYWIAQEALNNIRKHAQTSRTTIHLELGVAFVRMTIQDSGRGFDISRIDWTAKDGTGLGLLSMRERAAWIGGQTEFQTAPGEGTTVITTIPLSFRPVESGQPL